ncbi:hypothetical protein [Microbacterium sp.]|uniref:hypothetical protein n=1 Tax=Microbacterium sp. TaxID=51671 RepID=UPI002CEE48E3|nr:hypothetical protein [Microbacterium sp.]HWL79287.1 hypothetical protein [Microbacterium sp.]
MDEKPLLDDRLMAAYRPLRRVSGGDESPWPGALVRAASGDTCVLVEARHLDAQWPGWWADPDGHVLGALDLVRRAEGHDVVVPVCVERADAFVRRRGASGAPLSPGETVTLAVSIVRGFAELVTARAPVAGRWWVTDAGRPLFACGASGEAAPFASAELLRSLATPATAATLDEAVRAVLAERPSRHELDAVEQRLFGLARPEPLALTVFGPRRARSAMTDAAADPASPRRRAVIAESDAEPRGLIASLARHIDADLGDAVSRVVTEAWRRLRSARSGGRRRPWLLAGGLAVAIVTGGFVWPAGADDAVSTEAPPLPVSSVPTREGSLGAAPSDETNAAGEAVAVLEESTADSTTDVPAPGDLAAVADELLTARLACAGETSCLAAVAEDPSSTFPPGVVDLAGDARGVSLVDEFGGVAVLRVEPVGGASGAQLVVLVRGGEGWLLRDVYDVENG